MAIIADQSRSAPWVSQTFASLDTFTRQCVATALWSSTTDAGEPLDADHDASDIDADTLAVMVRDCESFQDRSGAMIVSDPSLAGHDFWLSRNGHGAGFFDGGWSNVPGHGAIGDTLQAMAKSFGEFDLYVGDDGRIHH